MGSKRSFTKLCSAMVRMRSAPSSHIGFHISIDGRVFGTPRNNWSRSSRLLKTIDRMNALARSSLRAVIERGGSFAEGFRAREKRIASGRVGHGRGHFYVWAGFVLSDDGPIVEPGKLGIRTGSN